MNMEAAQTHLFHHIDLTLELAGVQPGVPGPEGRATVFARWISEKAGLERLFFIFGIQHGMNSSFFRERGAPQRYSLIIPPGRTEEHGMI